MSHGPPHAQASRRRRSPRAGLWPVVLLCLTVPLLSTRQTVLGLPAWAVLSLVVTVVYAVVVAWLLRRAFDTQAGEAEASEPASEAR